MRSGFSLRFHKQVASSCRPSKTAHSISSTNPGGKFGLFQPSKVHESGKRRTSIERHASSVDSYDIVSDATRARAACHLAPGSHLFVEHFLRVADDDERSFGRLHPGWSARSVRGDAESRDPAQEGQDLTPKVSVKSTKKRYL